MTLFVEDIELEKLILEEQILAEVEKIMEMGIYDKIFTLSGIYWVWTNYY